MAWPHGAEMEAWGGVKGQWAAHFRGTSAHPSTLARLRPTDRGEGEEYWLQAARQAEGELVCVSFACPQQTDGRTDETRVPWPMVARAP